MVDAQSCPQASTQYSGMLDGRRGAGCAYAVSSMLQTLWSHHDWDVFATASLYIMCNNKEDVKTLEQDYLLRSSKGKVRCDTVASSASTTAKVAAVISWRGLSLTQCSKGIGTSVWKQRFLPIYNPAFDQCIGGRPPKELMPKVWANEGEEVLIHRQLMARRAVRRIPCQFSTTPAVVHPRRKTDSFI